MHLSNQDTILKSGINWDFATQSTNKTSIYKSNVFDKSSSQVIGVGSGLNQAMAAHNSQMLIHINQHADSLV